MKDKKQIFILGLMLLLSVIPCYGQMLSSDLSLAISRYSVNDLNLHCDLKNSSNSAIEIEDFLTIKNTVYVETPDGEVTSIGFIACGENKKNITLDAGASLDWEVDLNFYYFNPPFVKRPKKDGTYKFFYSVNGVGSNPIFYEYNRTRDK